MKPRTIQAQAPACCIFLSIRTTDGSAVNPAHVCLTWGCESSSTPGNSDLAIRAEPCVPATRDLTKLNFLRKDFQAARWPVNCRVEPASYRECSIFRRPGLTRQVCRSRGSGAPSSGRPAVTADCSCNPRCPSAGSEIAAHGPAHDVLYPPRFSILLIRTALSWAVKLGYRPRGRARQLSTRTALSWAVKQLF